MKLAAMRQDFEAAHTAFKTLLAERYGVDDFTWYRADAAINGQNCRRNEDTSRDAELAADKDVYAAHEEYLRLLHAFYLARDGEGGVLGGRGL